MLRELDKLTEARHLATRSEVIRALISAGIEAHRQANGRAAAA
jgi:metal-responsive CopG/Arc/MetJ family transcriptional regulator